MESQINTAVRDSPNHEDKAVMAAIRSAVSKGQSVEVKAASSGQLKVYAVDKKIIYSGK